MLIVKDIQDAITMKNKLSKVVRQANTFNKSKSEIIADLDMIVEDLIRNIDREEKAFEEHISNMALIDSDGAAVLGGQVS